MNVKQSLFMRDSNILIDKLQLRMLRSYCEGYLHLTEREDNGAWMVILVSYSIVAKLFTYSARCMYEILK